MIECFRYQHQYAPVWNEFVAKAKQAHFMFDRNYMDYHADRFCDHSLLFFENGKLIALLPANENGEQLISHGGLTFGGLITSSDIPISMVQEIFSLLKHYCQNKNFKKLIYKALPQIYCIYPAEESLYCLFAQKAMLIKREISSTILLKTPIALSGGKKNGIAKAKKNNLVLKQTEDYRAFMDMLSEILKNKYDTIPTHSAEEITLLANRFPENIKLYGAFFNEEMCAGVIIYYTKTLAHTQYLATTSKGKECGALDYLLAHLIMEASSRYQYFDFGISTEKGGNYLNGGLIAQKEMFGGRAICHDTYQLNFEI